mgnify:FL=1|tara:strand:+ start:1389 stop:1868 length:480 start_codon:yes stop_codon:yes gene_type:complete
MIDPVTAFAACSTAYKVLRKTVTVCQEIGQLSDTMAKWYGACQDLNASLEQRRNPTFLERRTLGKDTIEADSVRILLSQKENAKREYELKIALNMKFGPGTYKELQDLRKQMRQERRAYLMAQIESKRQIMNNCAIAALSFGILSVLGLGIYLLTLALP